MLNDCKIISTCCSIIQNVLNPYVNIFIDRMEPTEEDWNIISQILDNDEKQESANQEHKIIYTAYKLDGT